MAEIFDRLLIRMLLAIFICFIVFLYRYLHLVFYPTTKRQVLKKNNPAENPADTMHFYSRLLGLSIILSSISLNESTGLFLSLFHFSVWSLVAMILYLSSLFIIESIVFYHFNYTDEILKNRNLTYGFISMCNAIATGYLSRVIMIEAHNSFILLIVFWLFILVILGIAIKFYSTISELSFNHLIEQKNLSLAFSYAGFITGSVILVTSCFDEEDQYDLSTYLVQVLLKVILALLIFPLFKIGLSKAFPVTFSSKEKDQEITKIGYGIWEGILFLTGAILTSLLINRIHLGTVYL